MKCKVVGGRMARWRCVGREGGRVRRVVWRGGMEVAVWRGRARKWVNCWLGRLGGMLCVVAKVVSVVYFLGLVR